MTPSCHPIPNGTPRCRPSRGRKKTDGAGRFSDTLPEAVDRLDQIRKQADDHRTLPLAYASCARKLKLEKSKLVRVFADLSRNYSDLMNKPVASVKKLSMTLIQSPDLPVYTVGDENRLLQTILNVAESSRDWRPPEFYPASTDGYFYLRVQVKDSGCGVLPEDIPHLFTKFSQPRNGSNQINNGAGLGLAICKRFVNTMGGRIWIESEGYRQRELGWLDVVLADIESCKQ
ncbi:hypothetical protein ACFX2G_028898 [Malus domestica]